MFRGAVNESSTMTQVESPTRPARSSVARALAFLGWGAAPVQTFAFGWEGDFLFHQLQVIVHQELARRHWVDRQLWYMLDWHGLQKKLVAHPGSWPLYTVPSALRERLLSSLRCDGYEVHRPEPPQTDTTVLITWRASLYLKQQ